MTWDNFGGSKGGITYVIQRQLPKQTLQHIGCLEFEDGCVLIQLLVRAIGQILLGPLTLWENTRGT